MIVTQRENTILSVLSKNRQTPEQFNKVCNILSEDNTAERDTCDRGVFCGALPADHKGKRLTDAGAVIE